MSQDDPSKPVSPLSYASAGIAADSEIVTIAKCATVQEAALRANALEAAGIEVMTTNENTSSLGLYFQGISSIEVQVFKRDMARANDVLRLATSDDVEPTPEQPDSLPPAEEGGEPIALKEVARFATIRALREAALLLDSARIRAVPPMLMPREGPAGTGRRFILRVPESEAEQASEVLKDLEDDTDEEQMRCPKCDSWRVYPVSTFLPVLRWIFRSGEKPVAQMDCLQCRYRGRKEEFEPAR